FESPDDVIAQVDYYIHAISQYVSRQNWYERLMLFDNTPHVEVRMTSGISRVSHGAGGHIIYIFLNQRLFEHDLAPIAHEVAHVIVPSRGSRFLDEGLASYLHDRFGQNPTVFNWGLDPHILTRGFLTYEAEIFNAMLPVMATGNASENTFADGAFRSIFYISSNSFATYLIDTYGIENFMTLHASTNLINDYYTVLGKSREAVIAGWLEVVEAAPVMTGEEIDDYMDVLLTRHGIQQPG
ncbi:MAG: hypothetical protein FWD03_02765, partial [Defluviitaleaceae bacterium]|nr:hypothetical protein [Defluviitaleaceae bacterium]